jgi:hypothetical protein
VAIAGTFAALSLLQSACSSPMRDFDGAAGSSGDGARAGSGGSTSPNGKGGQVDGESGNDGDSGGEAGSSNPGGDAGSGNPGGDAGSGNAGECTTSDDCEGVDNDCSQRTCTDGKCGFEYAKSGVVVTAQSDGDCQKLICDGKGAIKSIADDTDKPKDGNVCIVRACTDGVPSQTPAPSTTACGSTLQFKCDGKGGCGGCVGDGDCGLNNLCATYKCVGGTCMNTFVKSGEGALANQAGDCKKNVCDGMGGQTTIADASDLPNDNKVCTKDVCTNGAPTNPPLSNTTSCGALSSCDGAGSCVCSDPHACDNVQCGAITNGCGAQVTCPNKCSGVNSCGGGGTANVCGCTPTHALNCGAQCGGVISDNCGNTKDCGSTNCQYVCPDNCSTKSCLSNVCYCADCNG